jgi:multiple sugar transport system substrate-binding protein
MQNRHHIVRALGALACAPALLSCSNEGDSKPARAPHPSTITALVWAPDWTGEMQQVATEFMRRNPDVRVNLQFMIGNSVEENIQPKMAAHKLPDLMSLNPNAYAAELADQGALADLGRSASWNALRPALKSDWTSPKGKRFGIAGGVAATLMYYNKRLFAQAGVTRPPADFEQFLAVCAQLKKAGQIPIMWNGGFPNMLANGPFSSGFANNIVARTPDWKARIAAGTLELDNADGADIFAKIKLVAERGYAQPGYMETNYDEGIRLFAEGKTAMAFHGTWASGLLLKGQGFEVGLFAPPWNAPGQAALPVIGSETGFAVSETGNKEAATRFLEFIMGDGFAIQQHKRQNLSPFIVAPGKPDGDARIAAYVEQASQAPVSASPYYSMLPANTIALLHPLIQDVLTDKVTPRAAAARLQDSIREQARQHYK